MSHRFLFTVLHVVEQGISTKTVEGKLQTYFKRKLLTSSFLDCTLLFKRISVLDCCDMFIPSNTEKVIYSKTDEMVRISQSHQWWGLGAV